MARYYDFENKRTHGEYIGRLPKGRFPCYERCGYSMWHLLAAKALSLSTEIEFLAEACDVSDNELIDDMRESMTVFDDSFKESWIEHSELRRGRFGWRNLCEATAWCTPLEICERLKVPLFRCSEEHILGYVHPVIEAAQMESLRRLG